MSVCPICKKAAAPRADNPSFPFCAARCKQVDLFHWLHETYRVPTSDQPQDEEAETSKEN